MSEETLKIMGMEFFPIDLNVVLGRTPLSFDYRINQWVESLGDVSPKRYLILIQDKNDLGYAVVEARDPRVQLKRVALGGSPILLKRRYPNREDYIKNVNVWIAFNPDTIKQGLENHLLGQWVDKAAEAARAKRVSQMIKRFEPATRAQYAQERPDSWKFLVENGYVDLIPANPVLLEKVDAYLIEDRPNHQLDPLLQS